jgi:hypothetical protein
VDALDTRDAPEIRDAADARATQDERGARGARDETFTALVRGPSSKLPRGYLWLIPVWLVVIVAALRYAWIRVLGPIEWWYCGQALAGLAFAALVMLSVLATVRHVAFRVGSNGIRLGVRSKRKRPKRRQAYLWWADIQQISIIPRHYGLLLEITLGPSARLMPHRSVPRQALLMLGMLIMPVGLGRGAPRLTEPRSHAPHYRIRICDVTPRELAVALAPLAPAAVDITMLTRYRHHLLARRLPATAQPAV